MPCPPLEDLPNPGIEPRSPSLQVDSLPSETPAKPKNTGVGSLFLLQGIFLTQESNRGLLHYRRILYQLSYQGSLQSTEEDHINRHRQISSRRWQQTSKSSGLSSSSQPAGAKADALREEMEEAANRVEICRVPPFCAPLHREKREALREHPYVCWRSMKTLIASGKELSLMGKNVGTSPMGGTPNPNLTSKPASRWPLHPERSYWRGRPGPGGLHLQRQEC